MNDVILARCLFSEFFDKDIRFSMKVSPFNKKTNLPNDFMRLHFSFKRLAVSFS